jgi:hypothetical protein
MKRGVAPGPNPDDTIKIVFLKEDKMAKEEQDTDVAEAPRDHQSELSALIQSVIAAATEQEGGLKLPVGLRGHRRVSEDLVFGPGSLEKVTVGVDFTFVLVLNGTRYWLQSKQENCAVLLLIRSHAGGPLTKFEFAEGTSFAGGVLPVVETVA